MAESVGPPPNRAQVASEYLALDLDLDRLNKIITEAEKERDATVARKAEITSFLKSLVAETERVAYTFAGHVVVVRRNFVDVYPIEVPAHVQGQSGS